MLRGSNAVIHPPRYPRTHNHENPAEMKLLTGFLNSNSDFGKETGDPSPHFYKWIGFMLFTIGLVTLAPLLNVGIVVNDDLKASSAALDGGLSGFFSMLWNMTLHYGRMHFFKIFTYYLPFAVDSFVYFKIVTLAALVGCLLLFSFFLRLLFESRKMFYMGLLLSLACLQISWEHNAIVSFAGLHTISLLYLLLSFITYLRYLREAKRACLWMSVILYALVLFPYEMFLIYAPVYFLLGLWERKSWRESLRKMVPHMLCLALFFLASFAFSYYRSADYPGATVNMEFHADRIWQVTWQFSKASVPGYFYLNSKYKALMDSYRDVPGQMSLFNSLQVSWIIKALLVAAVSWLLMRREELNRLGLNRSYGFLLAAGIAYFFLPSLPLGLTEHYQSAVITGGQLGMQTTYYSYFSFLWIAVLLLMAFSTLVSRLKPVYAKLGYPLLACPVVLLAIASLVDDFTNYYVGKEQEKAGYRWKLVDQFLKSPAYSAMPSGSVIYAPSLFRPVATVDFGGQAIDPTPPGKANLYANYWNFYFNLRGKKPVTVLDPALPAPYNPQGFYYLNYLTEPNSTAQSLVFCKIQPHPESFPSGVLLCDRAHIYDRSPRSSLLIGGLVQVSDETATVRIENGVLFETKEIFLLEADYRNFSYLKDVKELVITADKLAIRADSILIASGQEPPPVFEGRLELTKLTGWFNDNWIGPQATARVIIRTPKRLLITGFVPSEVFEALRWPEIGIKIKLDGVPIWSMSVQKGETFQLDEMLPGGLEHLLTIECDRYFVPSETGLGSDPRNLSAVITRIELKQ